MNIIKPNLKWARPLAPFRLAEIDGIALHHSEHVSADIYEIHRWHLNNGWAGVGYHYFVDKKGNVYEGRGMNFGAHTADHNSHLFGICAQGDYHSKDKIMPIEQFEAIVQLIHWLKAQVPTIKTVKGHMHWRPTACPGQFFPLAKVMSYANETDAERVAKMLVARGVTQDLRYWSDVLSGRLQPDPKFLTILFERLLK